MPSLRQPPSASETAPDRPSTQHTMSITHYVIITSLAFTIHYVIITSLAYNTHYVIITSLAYSSSFIGERHPFPRSDVFPAETSLGLSVPRPHIRGNQRGGGGTILVVRVEEGVDLSIHPRWTTPTDGRIGLLQFTRILHKVEEDRYHEPHVEHQQ